MLSCASVQGLLQFGRHHLLGAEVPQNGLGYPPHFGRWWIPDISRAMPALLETLFADEARRNPFPAYEQLRARTPVFQDPTTGLWLALDYDSVKRVLNDHELFSSRLGPAFWMVFLDPPEHTKLRGLIAQAFTPKSIANLEPRIAQLCHQLLEPLLEREEIDLVSDFSARLPMLVISEMFGLPAADGAQFWRWNEV